MNYPNRVIIKGETNKSVVKAIQQQLNSNGYGPLDVDGDFGNKTFNAVKLFQAQHRDQNGNPLEMDGKVGAVTWAILFGPQAVSSNDEAPNELLKNVLDVADRQIGIMEDPPGSNKGNEVNAYLASVGLPPGNFWCAAFIYWCFNQTCAKLNRSNPLVRTGSVLAHWNGTKGKKILAADAVNKPSLVKPGQIFILNFGGGHGHTGLVKEVNGGIITTIEGNSNPEGSSNGIGVFSLQRKIVKISSGFIEYK